MSNVYEFYTLEQLLPEFTRAGRNKACLRGKIEANKTSEDAAVKSSLAGWRAELVFEEQQFNEIKEAIRKLKAAKDDAPVDWSSLSKILLENDNGSIEHIFVGTLSGHSIWNISTMMIHHHQPL